MFKLLLVLSIFISNIANANIHQLVYKPVTEQKIIEANLYTLQLIMQEAEKYDRKDITTAQSLATFNYVQFDKAVSSLHPVFVYMVLKFYSDPIYSEKITAPVRKYLVESQAVPNLREAIMKKDKYIEACLMYNKMDIKSSEDFKKAVVEIIEFLSTVRV